MSGLMNALFSGLKKVWTIFATSYTTTKIAVACLILIVLTVEIHTVNLAGASSHQAFSKPYITMCSPNRVFDEMMDDNNGSVEWLRISSLITYMSGVVTVVLAIFVFITCKVFGNIYMIAVIAIHNAVCIGVFLAFYVREIYYDSTDVYEFLYTLTPISRCEGFRANFQVFVHNHFALKRTFYLCGKINILLGALTIMLVLSIIVDQVIGKELHPVLNYKLRPCVAKSCYGNQSRYTSSTDCDVEATSNKTKVLAVPAERKFLAQQS